MWDWKKLFSITSKPHKQSAIETAFLVQSKAMAEVMKRQADTIDLLRDTLDRIVTAKYDRPIAQTIKDQEYVPMPMFALNDQDDPSIEAGLAALTTESDEEFLAAAGVR